MNESGRVATVSQWLIRYAARRVPNGLSERLSEEWLADLASRSSEFAKLRFALGCCWAMRVISNDLQLSADTATATVTSPAVLSDMGPLSSRSSTLLLVAMLHAGLFYWVIHSVTQTPARLPAAPLQNQFVQKAEPSPVKPQLTPPQFDPVKIKAYVPVPIKPPDQVPAAETELQTETQQPLPPVQGLESDPGTPSAGAHVVQRGAGGTGAGFPNAADYYPLLAKHLEEQGLATVTVCVDPRGRLTAEPALARSSGSPRLDEGALKLARAGSGHYRAATEDGKPVTACYPLAIRFRLTQ